MQIVGQIRGVCRAEEVRAVNVPERPITAGHPLLVKALNDYAAHIPWSDLERYDPLLAWLRDGQPIPIRAKGPLIVIYPFTDRPELRGDIYNGRSVWHVSEIVFE